MEGGFSRPYKTGDHVHTNMAKSALNMMTRTLGESLAAEGILINSVDTGRITDERPYGARASNGLHTDFVPPLDVIDGAARVLDPIFRSAKGEFVGFGQFLKDYRSAAW
jgi:NAD(P)-dependent dehydrogenase (short-subunit alcohol dehydrogenase family)